MQIISQETFRYFIVQGAIIVLATIFSCYGIAVAMGHVPVWLPMISDCGVYPPEKYLFRLGLVTGSIFLHAESFLLYYADKAFSNSRLSMILSLLSSMGMAVVGVVNEKENNIVHTAAAIVTFGFYCLYMIVMTYYSSAEPTVGITSMTIKKVCTILGVGALATLAVLSFTGASRTYVALCECCPMVIREIATVLVMSKQAVGIGTVCIMTFNISFGADVDGIYLCEVDRNKDNNNNCDEKKITV